MPFYSVANGRETGVFKTWAECEAQVKGFQSAIFKKFSTEAEAENFIAEKRDKIIDKRKDKTTKVSSESKKRKLENVDATSSKKLKVVESINEKFTVDEDGFLIVYTDGSCLFNGRNGSKSGIGVYFGQNNSLNVSEPATGRATNNVAEIQAAISALKIAKTAKFDKVLINTDSDFMIKSMTRYMSSWLKKKWKKSDGNDVVNKEEFQTLNKVSEGLMVKWNHVNAHVGVEGNEAADRLAKEGAKRFVSQ